MNANEVFAVFAASLAELEAVLPEAEASIEYVVVIQDNFVKVDAAGVPIKGFHGPLNCSRFNMAGAMKLASEIRNGDPDARGKFVPWGEAVANEIAVLKRLMKV